MLNCQLALPAFGHRNRGMVSKAHVFSLIFFGTLVALHTTTERKSDRHLCLESTFTNNKTRQ